MTLQQFIHFDQYVRCFTFGKTDIMPVRYDPHERRYLVEHEYLSPELGARIVRDAQTLNNALGYEMNTIEFAVQDGVPYAIDFLNPAPDFERDRITPLLLRDGRAEDGRPRDRPRAARAAAADVAALGADGGSRRRRTGLERFERDWDFRASGAEPTHRSSAERCRHDLPIDHWHACSSARPPARCARG